MTPWMNICEICGSDCYGEICPDCLTRMETHDSSDIQARVDQFDNRDYEIDAVKIHISNYYRVDPERIVYEHHMGHSYSKAKQLFIYALFTRFGMRNKDICKLMKVSPTQVNYFCKLWDKKLSCELTNKRWLDLINSK